MGRYTIFVACMVVLISGCMVTSGGGDETETIERKSSPDSDNRSSMNSSVTSKYTKELNSTITQYQNYNRSGGIDIIIKVSDNTSRSEFNTTVSIVHHNVTRIRFVFADQRLIAATAEPKQIKDIVEIESIELISIDREVSSD